MTYKTLLLLLIGMLLFACKKNAPTQVKAYSTENIETLNGNVKEIYSSSSFSKHNFSSLTFDRKGQMVALKYSWLNISTTADKTDSIVNEESNVYSYKYEKISWHR